MGITKAIGKNTLGGGKKMNVSMRSYNRSTHDLSYAWRSTMNVGTLVPFMSEIAIDLSSSGTLNSFSVDNHFIITSS